MNSSLFRSRIKYLTIAGLLIGLLWIWFCPSALSVSRETRIEKLDNNNTASIEIPIRNIGFGLLKISSVSTSCGCLSLTYPQYILPFCASSLKAVIQIKNPTRQKEVQIAMISNSFSVSNAITTVVYTPYAKMKLLLSAIDLSTDIDKNQLDQIHHYTIGESLTDSSIFVIGNSSELTEAGFDVNITQKASDICLTVKVADKSLRGHLSGVVKIYEKASKLPLGEVELGASIQSN